MTEPPLLSIKKIIGFPARSEEKAIVLPSGETAGSTFIERFGPLVICTTVAVWFLPYQSTVYLALYHGSGELFAHARARKVALLWGVLVLISVALAVPIWRGIGLLR